MTFVTGTLTDGGGSVNANMTALQSLIRDTVVAHPAWELASEAFVDVGANDRNEVVLRCLAAQSGLPVDFHVGIGRYISGTSIDGLLGWCAEQVNVGAQTFTDPVVLPASVGNRTMDADGTINAAAAPWGSLTNALAMTLGTKAATLDYWIVVRDDGMAFGMRVSGTSYAYYWGAFESLVDSAAVNDPMPLCFVNLKSSDLSATSADASTSRHPLTGGQALTHTHGITPPTASRFNSEAEYGALAGFSNPDRLQGDKVAFPRVLVINSAMAASVAMATTHGILRGRYKGIRRLYAPPVGTGYGDTVTFDGTKWVWTGTNSFATFLDTGEAA